MNHDCIGSLGSIPNEPKSSPKVRKFYILKFLKVLNTCYASEKFLNKFLKF